jgi:DNA segregation ATPase FtsK/SpoIIIE, S-DNA-T family
MFKHKDRPGAARSDAPLVSAEDVVREWDRRHGRDKDAWLLGEVVVLLGLGVWMVVKALWWVVRFLAREPAVSGVAMFLSGLCALLYLDRGAFVAAVPLGLVAVALAVWRMVDREGWDRLVGWRVLASWRAWRIYGRRWRSVMTLTGLTDSYAGEDLVPKLERVVARDGHDRLIVRMIEGQHPDDYTAAAERLAHSFGIRTCRARRVVDHRGLAVPGAMWLDMHYRDPLVEPLPAIPLPAADDGREVS